MSASITYFPFGLPPVAGPLRFGSESDAGEGCVDWLLKRNCSASPRLVLTIYAALCAVSLGIAGLCWAVGATLVLPFAWIELLGLGAALLLYARHAADSETIRLQPGRLTVEHSCAGHVRRVEFAPEWVRVEPRLGDRSLIELSGQGRRIAVGRFVRPELRQPLAQELRWALRRWSRSRPAGAC